MLVETHLSHTSNVSQQKILLKCGNISYISKKLLGEVCPGCTHLIRISLSANVQTPLLLDIRARRALFIGQTVHTNLAKTKLAFAFSVCLRIYIQHQYLQFLILSEH